ncbi:MAG: bifunctional 5,10-methylenetetrahydrofolate dehydrogenase/5,10-methenyltetrahydrofolate cyclohydrolase [Candidatus Gracilibacteria bacterium]
MEPIKIAGKPFSDKVLTQIREVVEKEQLHIKIAVILVGDNPASLSYIRKKQQAAESVGYDFVLIQKETSITQEELEELVDQLNADQTMTGYIIQMPLPKHLNSQALIERIAPKKDIDGFHPLNIGRLFLGAGEYLPPATARAIVELLEMYNIPVEGKHAVIIGRSNIVGKPLSVELINRGATVTVCNSKTQGLKDITLSGDIVIAATGNPKLITEDMIKDSAVTIDVGCTFCDGKAVGDIDTENIQNKVKAYAPVPGGVGPGTVCMLIKNALTAYRLQHVS